MMTSHSNGNETEVGIVDMNTVEQFKAEWLEDETPLNIFNEIQAVKHSVKSLKASLLGLMGVILIFVFSAFAVSFKTLVVSNSVSVDGESGALIRSSDKTAVSTIATGLTFRMPVFFDASPRPFNCVGIGSARDLWNAVSDGIHT